MSERRLTYSFGPLERRGLLGPVRAGQAAMIAAGGVAGIAALDASPSALGVVHRVSRRWRVRINSAGH